MEVDGTHMYMMGGRMALCEVVTKVVFPWLPINTDVPLVDSVRDPMEAHVHGFGVLEFCGAVGKATGGGIVGGDACGSRLCVANFLLVRCGRGHRLPLWLLMP